MPFPGTREERVRLSRYMVVLCAIWVIAMTWRLYPQFKDTLRIDGRVMSYADYVAESCGEAMGPAAATCLGEARSTGRRLVAREQAKSLLLIEAPLLAYLLIHLPLKRLWQRAAPGAGEALSQ
jgi:hypothetical protein